MARDRLAGRQTSSPDAGARRRSAAKKLVGSEGIALGPPVDVNPLVNTTAKKKGRYPRHVADHILIAFHQTCDQRDLEVAEQLLAVLARVIAGSQRQPTAPDQHDKESLVAAYERLWDLRHPCGWGAR
jgi:hypothetical protein